jgi:uncharacterized protein (DUF488 family)
MNKGSHENSGQCSPVFRGYADYLQTQEFKERHRELMTIAKEKNVVIMCAEAVPWRCHRLMVSSIVLKFRTFGV